MTAKAMIQTRYSWIYGDWHSGRNAERRWERDKGRRHALGL